MSQYEISGIEFKASPAGQVAVNQAKGIVECFVAGIGNKDSVGDICASGAFNESLKRRKPRVVWGHNWNDPIGKVLEIYEVPASDPRLPGKMKQAGIGGLYAKVQFNLNSEKGREAFANVQFFGLEQEWSIGYKTLDAVFDPSKQANVLKEVELYEVSPVLHGANQLTGTISVKHAQSSQLQAVIEDLNDINQKMHMMHATPGNPTGKPRDLVDSGIVSNPSPERRNDLEMEIASRVQSPIKLVHATDKMAVFAKLSEDGGKRFYRLPYHWDDTTRQFMFGKPERVAPTLSFEPVRPMVVPRQMPSMPMEVKPSQVIPRVYGTQNWDQTSEREKSAASPQPQNVLIECSPEEAFQVKSALDPVFQYHNVAVEVTEHGIKVLSEPTKDFLQAVTTAHKTLFGGGSKKALRGIGPKLGGGLRAAPSGMSFVDITGRVDADGDGIVFEGVPGMERPIIPRFLVPKDLARRMSSLVQGDSMEIEKARRAGNTSAQMDESQLQKLLGKDFSKVRRADGKKLTGQVREAQTGPQRRDRDTDRPLTWDDVDFERQADFERASAAESRNGLRSERGSRFEEMNDELEKSVGLLRRHRETMEAYYGDSYKKLWAIFNGQGSMRDSTPESLAWAVVGMDGNGFGEKRTDEVQKLLDIYGLFGEDVARLGDLEEEFWDAHNQLDDLIDKAIDADENYERRNQEFEQANAALKREAKHFGMVKAEIDRIRAADDPLEAMDRWLQTNFKPEDIDAYALLDHAESFVESLNDMEDADFQRRNALADREHYLWRVGSMDQARKTSFDLKKLKDLGNGDPYKKSWSEYQPKLRQSLDDYMDWKKKKQGRHLRSVQSRRQANDQIEVRSPTRQNRKYAALLNDFADLWADDDIAADAARSIAKALAGDGVVDRSSLQRTLDNLNGVSGGGPENRIAEVFEFLQRVKNGAKNGVWVDREINPGALELNEWGARKIPVPGPLKLRLNPDEKGDLRRALEDEKDRYRGIPALLEYDKWLQGGKDVMPQDLAESILEGFQAYASRRKNGQVPVHMQAAKDVIELAALAKGGVYESPNLRKGGGLNSARPLPPNLTLRSARQLLEWGQTDAPPEVVDRFRGVETPTPQGWHVLQATRSHYGLRSERSAGEGGPKKVSRASVDGGKAPQRGRPMGTRILSDVEKGQRWEDIKPENWDSLSADEQFDLFWTLVSNGDGSPKYAEKGPDGEKDWPFLAQRDFNRILGQISKRINDKTVSGRKRKVRLLLAEYPDIKPPPVTYIDPNNKLTDEERAALNPFADTPERAEFERILERYGVTWADVMAFRPPGKIEWNPKPVQKQDKVRVTDEVVAAQERAKAKKKLDALVARQGALTANEDSTEAHAAEGLVGEEHAELWRGLDAILRDTDAVGDSGSDEGGDLTMSMIEALYGTLEEYLENIRSEDLSKEESQSVAAATRLRAYVEDLYTTYVVDRADKWMEAGESAASLTAGGANPDDDIPTPGGTAAPRLSTAWVNEQRQDRGNAPGARGLESKRNYKPSTAVQQYFDAPRGLRSEREYSGRTQVTDESKNFQAIMDALPREIQKARTKGDTSTVEAFERLADLLKRQRANKGVMGALTLSQADADSIMDALMVAIDRHLDKRRENDIYVAMFTKLLDQLANAAMSTFITRETEEIFDLKEPRTNEAGDTVRVPIIGGV